MIVIIDYQLGNLASISNMLKKCGEPSLVSGDPQVIKQAKKLILPGVGAFAKGMAYLKQQGLIDILQEKVQQEKTPILGICLGMQLLTKGSEEGDVAGLGWIDAHTKKFNLGENPQKLKIPHMGWNVAVPQKNSQLFSDITEAQRFYFVHSFYVACHETSDVLAKTHYSQDFASAIERDNIFGVQFHPEKSHKFGMNLLKRFSEL